MHPQYKSIVDMVLEKIKPSHWTYRFDKASNFISYEEYCERNAIETLIRLGKELEILEKFKGKSDQDLADMVDKWQTQPSVSMSNELFDKYEGIDASNELGRRKEVLVRSREAV